MELSNILEQRTTVLEEAIVFHEIPEDTGHTMAIRTDVQHKVMGRVGSMTMEWK